jgi:hypothetical protein
MTTEHDDTENIRRTRLVAINSAVASADVNTERQQLEAQHGQMWDSKQLAQEFEVVACCSRCA